MTDGVTVALSGGAVAIIVAAIQRVHTLVNSRMTEMLELAKKSSHVEGMKDEKDSVADA